MKKTALFLFLLVGSMCLFACGPAENEDVTTSVDKESSVEVLLSFDKLKDGRQVLKTQKIIWVKNKQSAKIVNYDTLPDLGSAKQTAEDEDGDEINVVIPKNYELFITVQ